MSNKAMLALAAVALAISVAMGALLVIYDPDPPWAAWILGGAQALNVALMWLALKGKW